MITEVHPSSPSVQVICSNLQSLKAYGWGKNPIKDEYKNNLSQAERALIYIIKSQGAN